MLSRSEASLVPEAEILRSGYRLAQDDNRSEEIVSWKAMIHQSPALSTHSGIGAISSSG
jgi:hypothetical protein